jgi:hypothetical protein
VIAKGAVILMRGAVPRVVSLPPKMINSFLFGHVSARDDDNADDEEQKLERRE